MKTLILILLLPFLFMSTAFAQVSTLDCSNINITGLTSTQIQNIQKACNDLNPDSISALSPKAASLI